MFGTAIVTAFLLSGCMAVEENPLNVNTARGVPENVSAVEAIPEDFGDDPLNLGKNGSTLCTAQPPIGYQEFTVLIHNELLSTFTVDDVRLESAEDLSLLKAEISTANRDGHHKTQDGEEGAGHGTHSAEAAPAESESEEPVKAGPVEPVPATGYGITTHEYVNLVVSVSIAEGTESGTAQGITVDYSTDGQEFTNTHPLVLTMDRESCS
ncbi:hypothetical protein [Arthrobacter sp. H5]|uniref:hypothetical protein n=1 Tax=Arthrobacter sp. H5 TaxID=1267973 RepID=UPI001C1E393E|nr:hypothetical protein [Arthrobacter sp. H5]